MTEGEWLLTIGALDHDAAGEHRDRLQHGLGDSLTVKLIDHRATFAGVWDVTSVRGLISVLEAGSKLGRATT